MYAFSSYPIAEPTSDFSLSLAQGADSIELDRRDPFAANVRAVAARIGVKDPERLSIRVGEQTNGASLGTNATIGQRGACVILPAELYDAFHATPAQRQRFDLPDRDEIDFVLAHESAHIAKNHLLLSGAFLPVSLMSTCWLIKKVPNKLVATVAGTIALVGSNMLLSWRIEHEADHVAAAHGYARGGIHCFERKLSRNCEMRSALRSRLITKEGNYLGDAAHPLLTSRIQHLQLIADAAAVASGTAGDNGDDHHLL
ncbi:hypothetical protein PybrP1_003831, partial [[Pythium] brassicae (nom. inval.)]